MHKFMQGLVSAQPDLFIYCCLLMISSPIWCLAVTILASVTSSDKQSCTDTLLHHRTKMDMPWIFHNQTYPWLSLRVSDVAVYLTCFILFSHMIGLTGSSKLSTLEMWSEGLFVCVVLVEGLTYKSAYYAMFLPNVPKCERNNSSWFPHSLLTRYLNNSTSQMIPNLRHLTC